jgi:aminoglycoside phosphotransferase family enzyme
MAGKIDQEPVIEFLSRGVAYGRPRDPVQRIDTHASVVFLTGDRAYKLKRAIRFSYLDYSTAEKREAMCRAELALNRRAAPQLYLGICAVTRAPDGALALGGSGQAVDWLVEMRRFPQDDLFDRMAERHALTMPLMVALADEIAAFHTGAETCGDHDFDGRMEAIAGENLDNLRRTGQGLDQRKVADLAALTRVVLDRVAPMLKGRGSRRCHGALHLRNICLIDGKPVLFDGIEFNDAFTCTDPLYDLAFLLIDLDHRDLGDLGNTVFNRYLDRVGEAN